MLKKHKVKIIETGAVNYGGKIYLLNDSGLKKLKHLCNGIQVQYTHGRGKNGSQEAAVAHVSKPYIEGGALYGYVIADDTQGLSGKNVSLAYKAFTNTDKIGTYHNIPYAGVLEPTSADHLAIVKEGRYEDTNFLNSKESRMKQSELSSLVRGLLNAKEEECTVLNELQLNATFVKIGDENVSVAELVEFRDNVNVLMSRLNEQDEIEPEDDGESDSEEDPEDLPPKKAETRANNKPRTVKPAAEPIPINASMGGFFKMKEGLDNMFGGKNGK